ncbi:MAG: cytochrome c biogenesis CcdA family protein [Geobacteraceae bacterium]|nr:cytochrome c biogenesis CcdA family protein [Geobacteraceae bacterium]
MESTHISIVGAFVAGLLSFLSPCVLPLIPSYITYITGISFADLKEEHTSRTVRKKTVIHSLLFIAGFTFVFMALGASATYVGSFLQGNMDLIRKIGGLLIIVFGIHVTGLVNLSVLLGDRRIRLNKKPAGYAGSFLVGIAFAAGWTPCIGPILASILMIAATEEKVYQGMVLLFSYSLGLGTPFFISSLALHKFLVLFNRFKKMIRIFELGTGLFLIVVGVLVFTNSLTAISQYITILFRGGF